MMQYHKNKLSFFFNIPGTFDMCEKNWSFSEGIEMRICLGVGGGVHMFRNDQKILKYEKNYPKQFSAKFDKKFVFS